MRDWPDQATGFVAYGAQTGSAIAVLNGHQGGVSAAAFSPDGACVVTASRDKTARLWDAQTGAAISVLSGHDDAVWSAAFSPDGARVVTASSDKTARLWDAAPGAPRICEPVGRRDA